MKRNPRKVLSSCSSADLLSAPLDEGLPTECRQRNDSRNPPWPPPFVVLTHLKDTTLTFAARRQIPTRYNRKLAATTLHAMERISEIRARRERAFYKNRMAGNKERALAAAKKVIEMDEKYKMFAEKDTVEEEDLMALEEQEQWASSDEEVEDEKEKVRIPVISKWRQKARNTEMEVDG
jgi:large subunit ribosomal protein L24e